MPVDPAGRVAPSAIAMPPDRPASDPKRWVHRTDVQGLRALAVLLVVAHHAGAPLPGGFTGVDVFFVISGFVITGLLTKELAATGTVRLREFYIRRVHRLLPALGLVSTVTAVLSILLLSPLGVQQEAGQIGAAASLWTSNLALYKLTSSYFAADVAGNPFLHTWSLAVEEQFYLVFPGLVALVAWLGSRRRRPDGRSRLRRVWWVIALVGTVSFVVQVALTSGVVKAVGRPVDLAFYLSPTRAWEFCLGALVVAAPVVRRRWAVALGWLGLAAVTYGVLSIEGSQPFPGWAALFPALGTAALIWGGAGSPGSPLTAALSSRPMVWLGDRSYSWYLWHWPFLVFARRLAPDTVPWTVLAVVLSLGVAAWSFTHVEQRLRIRGRQRRTRPGLVVAAVAVPSALCLLLATGGAALWWSPNLQSLRALEQQPIRHATCLNTTPVSARDIALCTWGGQETGAPIYLVGDSNAQQYSEAVIGAGAELHRPVVVAAMGSCLPAVMQTRDDAGDGGPCLRFVADLVRWLGLQRPGTVLLTGSAEAVFGDVPVRATPGAPWVSDRAGRERVVGSGLEQFIRAVQGAGHEAVVIEALPHLPGVEDGWWMPAECPNWTLISNPRGCGTEFPLSVLDARDAQWLRAQHEAVDRTRARLLPVRAEVCPGGTCATWREGRWVYRDGVHLTAVRSGQLSSYAAQQLRLLSAR